MEGTDIALIAIPEVTPSCVGIFKVFDLWEVTLGSLWWKKENRATSCAIVGFPFVTKMFDQSQTIKELPSQLHKLTPLEQSEVGGVAFHF